VAADLCRAVRTGSLKNGAAAPDSIIILVAGATMIAKADYDKNPTQAVTFNKHQTN
jgi:hypothetical protein